MHELQSHCSATAAAHIRMTQADYDCDITRHVIVAALWTGLA